MSWISKALGGVGKAIGKVAGVAAPFVGGPAGALLGLVGGLGQAGGDQKRADGAMGMSAEAIAQYRNDAMKALGMGDPNAAFMNSQYTPVFQEMMRSAGIDPTTGQSVAGYNPYQSAIDQVGNNRAAIYNQASEATDPAFDDAVSAAMADFEGRGIGGSAVGAKVANIRRQQAQARAGVMRDIGINNQNQRLDLTKAGVDARMQNMRGLAPFLMQNRELGSQMQGRMLGVLGDATQLQLGHLGGVQGLYQSRANQGQQALGGLADAFGKAGGFDWLSERTGLSGILKRRGQAGGSKTPGATTSQSPSPTPGINPGGGLQLNMQPSFNRTNGMFLGGG